MGDVGRGTRVIIIECGQADAGPWLPCTVSTAIQSRDTPGRRRDFELFLRSERRKHYKAFGVPTFKGSTF